MPGRFLYSRALRYRFAMGAYPHTAQFRRILLKYGRTFWYPRAAETVSLRGCVPCILVQETSRKTLCMRRRIQTDEGAQEVPLLPLLVPNRPGRGDDLLEVEGTALAVVPCHAGILKCEVRDLGEGHRARP